MPNPFETNPGRVAGQNLSLSGSRKVPDALPAQGNILHDWHFGDLSQLSQDVAGLVPASEHGTPIARIDDKGSDPVPLLQSVLGKRPLVDKSVHNVITGKFFAPGHVLHALPANGLPAAYTLAAYFYFDPPPNDEDHIVFFWDSTSELSIRMQPDAVPLTLGLRHEFTVSGSPLSGPFSFDLIDTPGGAIVSSDSVPSQRLISSFQSAEVTDTNAHNPPDAARFCGIGANTDDATPQDDLTGRVGRVVIWDITLDLEQRNAAKNFGASAYDIVWQ